MRGLIILALTTSVTLGCTPQLAPLEPLQSGPAAPDGTVVLRDNVDGLLVGDRLMDAGEYQLALRAYHRAAAEDGISADTLAAIGSANLRLGRLGQAEDTLRQALAQDEAHVPSLNNLGVVLVERGEYGEARRLFEQAFALDSGQSDSIRDNLRLAIARMENSVYSDENNQNDFGLIRRSEGVYILQAGP